MEQVQYFVEVISKTQSRFPYTSDDTVQERYRGHSGKADHAFHQGGSSEAQSAAEVNFHCHSDRTSPDSRPASVPA